jgi:hypothetical protein
VAGGEVVQDAALNLQELALGGAGSFVLTNHQNRVQLLSNVASAQRPRTLEYSTASSLQIGSGIYGSGLSLVDSLLLQVDGKLTVSAPVLAGGRVELDLGASPTFETALPQQDAVGTAPAIRVESPAVNSTGLKPYLTVTPKAYSPDVEISAFGEVQLRIVVGRPGEQGLTALVDWGDGTREHFVQGTHPEGFQPGIPFVRSHLYTLQAIQSQFQDSPGEASGSNELPIAVSAGFLPDALRVTRDVQPKEQARIENTGVPRDTAGLPTQHFVTAFDPTGRVDLTQNILSILISSPGITSPGLAVREFGSPEIIAIPARRPLDPVDPPTISMDNQTTVVEALPQSDAQRSPVRELLVVRRVLDDEQVEEREFFLTNPCKDSNEDKLGIRNGVLTDELPPPDDLPSSLSMLRSCLRRLPDGHYQILSLEVDGQDVLSKTVLWEVFLNDGQEIAPDLVEPPVWPPATDVPPEPVTGQTVPPDWDSATPSQTPLSDVHPQELRAWPRLWAAQSLARVRQTTEPPGSGSQADFANLSPPLVPESSSSRVLSPPPSLRAESR